MPGGNFDFADNLTRYQESAVRRRAATQQMDERDQDRQRQNNIYAAYQNAPAAPEVAADALLAQGDTQGAATVRGQARTRETQGRADAVRAAMAKNDFDGAKAAAGGDPDMLGVVEVQQKKALTRMYQANDLAYGVAEKLKSVPPERRAEHLAYATEQLKQQYPELPWRADSPTDDASLTHAMEQFGMLRERIAPALEKLGKGDRLVRKKADGTADVVIDAVDEPKVLGKDQILVAPGQGGAPGGGQPAAAGPADPNAPRGVRNNNPLNLRPLGQGSWEGQTGVDDGNFAQFGSMEAGLAAADKNLQTYGTKYGINTVAGVINRWAPGSDGNDPASYAATVAKTLGVEPNAQIDLTDPQVRQGMLKAMAQVELGQPLSGVAGAGTGQAGNPGEGGGYQVLARGPVSDPKTDPERRLTTNQVVAQIFDDYRNGKPLTAEQAQILRYNAMSGVDSAAASDKDYDPVRGFTVAAAGGGGAPPPGGGPARAPIPAGYSAVDAGPGAAPVQRMGGGGVNIPPPQAPQARGAAPQVQASPTVRTPAPPPVQTRPAGGNALMAYSPDAEMGGKPAAPRLPARGQSSAKPQGRATKASYSRVNPARPMSKADLDALDPGTPFVNPADGRVLVKR